MHSLYVLQILRLSVHMKHIQMFVNLKRVMFIELFPEIGKFLKMAVNYLQLLFPEY